MRMRLLVAVFVLAVTALPARSEEAPKRFGDWIVECGPAGKGQKCFASQELRPKDNEHARILKFSIGYLGAKGEPVVVVLLPLGISLAAGAAFAIDGTAQIPLTLQQCLTDGCVGSTVLQEPTLAALRDAKQIVVGIVPFGGPQTATFALSSKGLKEALASVNP